MDFLRMYMANSPASVSILARAIDKAECNIRVWTGKPVRNYQGCVTIDEPSLSCVSCWSECSDNVGKWPCNIRIMLAKPGGLRKTCFRLVGLALHHMECLHILQGLWPAIRLISPGAWIFKLGISSFYDHKALSQRRAAVGIVSRKGEVFTEPVWQFCCWLF